MIGPDIPVQFLSTAGDDINEAGPSIPSSIGPAIPPEVLARSQQYNGEDEDEEDYAPALPPDLVIARGGPAGSSKQIQGPALPPSSARQRYGESDDDEDDDYGPMPLPAGVAFEESDGVREFLEKEERRRKQVEEASKPKALQREEWMLVPPSSSDLLASIDPTKLTKGRQFARTAAPSRNVDNSLWTETPAERQQRLADEVAGKRRRAVNADPDAGDESKEAESRKKRRRDEEIRKGVDEYTKKNRGSALLDQHGKSTKEESKNQGEEDEGPPVIWEHSRDMALGGRLMDDKTRNKFIQEAKGLGDRFGTGKSGGFL
ncbi:hypothetical protein PHLCEN_2v5953 [Hermanssonia centrifuga]|uniref:DUF3752 domain-containing protein n=1 Tax=Hermanssonia centrifuga TaxID=98765 RepID=A0A2R6P107_9APHY|nr:hypothetical protein PHLCEN_2v5953 [Hermanssonia centrifuga]